MSKWCKVDISGLKKLQKQIENSVKQCEQIENSAKQIEQMKLDIANKLADEFLNEVIKRTPTSENNQLKTHWKAQVLKNGTGYNIIVSNDLQYASYVEYGKKLDNGSWKKGYYMLHITELDIERKINNISEPIIDKYLKEIFK